MTIAQIRSAVAFLRPSGASGWRWCAGKPRMERLYPEDTSSPEAREGTAAHWALAEVLNGRAVAAGQLTPDSFVLTDEMVEAAADVLRWIHALMAKHGGEVPRMFVEQYMRIERVHPACAGTTDLALYFPIARVLYVADYKFGFGWVEVFENWQLLCYLAGMLQLLNISGTDNDELAIVLAVVQPRAFHPDGAIRTWETTATKARPLITQLHDAARAAMEPEALCVVNDTCDNCNANHACPALQGAALRAMDYAKRAVPFDLPPHALGLELANVRAAIRALEARETGLAGQAEALIKGGTRVPFWSIESKPGNLKWTVPKAEVIALGKLIGMELRKPDDVLTPTQARDAGLDPNLLQAYAERPAGAAKLVLQTDDSARKIFS